MLNAVRYFLNVVQANEWGGLIAFSNQPRRSPAVQGRTSMNGIDVWVPALPDRALSANGGGRSRRNPWELADAKLALGDVAYHAVLAKYAPAIPALQAPVVVTVTLHAAHGRKPKDHLYRPLDPGNIGGDVLKPLLDYGLVRHGIIADDDHNTIHEIRLRVRHVESLAEEGIALEVRELPRPLAEEG